MVFGNNAPDSGNAELLAAGMEMTGRDDIRARWLDPLLSGDDPIGVLHDRARHRRQRPAAPQEPRRQRDGGEWVINGHKWYTTNGSVADILIVMAVTNPEVHPYQGSSMFVVPVATKGVTILRDVGAMDDPEITYGQFGNHAEILYEDVRVPDGPLDRSRGRGLRARPGAARAGTDPSLHALARSVSAGLRHDVRTRLSRYTHGSLLSEKQTILNWIADSKRRDARRAPHDPARRLEDGPGRQRRARATRSP